MGDRRCALLEDTFDRQGPAFVAALRVAYDTATELYDASRGSNEHLFGLSVYHFSAHEISRAAEARPGEIVILSRAPTFRFRVGEFELACHRVPRGDIWKSFPGNDGAVTEMVPPQLWLPHLGPIEVSDELVDNARKLVLAHMGDVEEGLVGVYVCLPIGVSDANQIDRWGYVKSLSLDESPAAQQAPDGPTAAPEEAIEAVPVRRKRRGASDHGGK